MTEMIVTGCTGGCPNDNCEATGDESSLHDGISTSVSVDMYYDTVYPEPRAWHFTIRWSSFNEPYLIVCFVNAFLYSNMFGIGLDKTGNDPAIAHLVWANMYWSANVRGDVMVLTLFCHAGPLCFMNSYLYCNTHSPWIDRFDLCVVSRDKVGRDKHGGRLLSHTFLRNWSWRCIETC